MGLKDVWKDDEDTAIHLRGKNEQNVRNALSLSCVICHMPVLEMRQ